MTPERIAEIRAACEAATPGPWEADLSPGSDPDEGIPDHGWAWPAKLYSDGGGDYMLWGDVQFCVVARTAVPELLAEVERLKGILVAVRAEMERLRAGATRECGMLDLGHTEPANVCDACYVQVVHMLGEAEAENARLRAQGCGITNKPLNRRLADQLADWIEGRVDSDHPEACAGRHCICQTLAAYRASAEVLSE